MYWAPETGNQQPRSLVAAFISVTGQDQVVESIRRLTIFRSVLDTAYGQSWSAPGRHGRLFTPIGTLADAEIGLENSIMQYLIWTLHMPACRARPNISIRHRASWSRPARSAVLGLASLGVRRNDDDGHAALAAGYGYAVRIRCHGTLNARLSHRGDAERTCSARSAVSPRGIGVRRPGVRPDEARVVVKTHSTRSPYGRAGSALEP